MTISHLCEPVTLPEQGLAVKQELNEPSLSLPGTRSTGGQRGQAQNLDLGHDPPGEGSLHANGRLKGIVPAADKAYEGPRRTGGVGRLGTAARVFSLL